MWPNNDHDQPALMKSYGYTVKVIQVIDAKKEGYLCRGNKEVFVCIHVMEDLPYLHFQIQRKGMSMMIDADIKRI